DVAEEADQAGHGPAGLGAEDAPDVGGVDGHHTAPAQDWGSSWKGRTSTGPPQAALPSAASFSAASRSGALTTQKPPSCSLASANGPSVVRTSAPVASTTVAVSAG